MNSQFQTLLDQGEALKERLAALNKVNKNSLQIELRAWFNSVIIQTQDSPYFGTESLNKIYGFANLFLEYLNPKEVRNQIDQAIELIASIPSREPTPPSEISVSLELQKLISLSRVASGPSRKPWEDFVERLNALKRKHALAHDKSVPVEISGLTDDFLRELRLDETETEARNIAAEYERLKTAVEARVSWIAWGITQTAYLVFCFLIMLGGLTIILSHPFHYDPVNLILGVAVILFVVMELAGIFHHLASLRSKLESFIRPKLRRLFGIEESPDPHTDSVLGLLRNRR